MHQVFVFVRDCCILVQLGARILVRIGCMSESPLVERLSCARGHFLRWHRHPPDTRSPMTIIQTKTKTKTEGGSILILLKIATLPFSLWNYANGVTIQASVLVSFSRSYLTLCVNLIIVWQNCQMLRRGSHPVWEFLCFELASSSAFCVNLIIRSCDGGKSVSRLEWAVS